MGNVKRENEQQHENANSRIDEILMRANHLAALGLYAKAADLLASGGRDPRVLNAKGVCLMRCGRYGDAIRLYRDLVLNPGCTWMRTNLPTVYKTNFATALLLGGHPSGCLVTLFEIGDEQNPTVVRLHEAIKRWEKQLSFWQWLNWRTGRIDPANRPVSLDFEPGEFETTGTVVAPSNKAA